MKILVNLATRFAAVLVTNEAGQANLKPEIELTLRTKDNAGEIEDFAFAVTPISLRELIVNLQNIADAAEQKICPLIVSPALQSVNEIEPLLERVRGLLAEIEPIEREKKGGTMERLNELKAELDLVDDELLASGWDWRNFVDYADPNDVFPAEITKEMKRPLIEELARESFAIVGQTGPEFAARMKVLTDKFAELSRKGFNCRENVLNRVGQLQSEGFSPKPDFEDFWNQAVKGAQFRGVTLTDEDKPKFVAAHESGMLVMDALTAFVKDPEWNPGACGCGEEKPTAPPVADPFDRIPDDHSEND